VNTVELYLTDEEGEVKYTAAATVLRLTAIKESRHDKKPKEKLENAGPVHEQSEGGY
jgi:hypothetical protein